MEQIRKDFQTLINHFLTMVEGDGLSDMLLNYVGDALYNACVKHACKIGKKNDMVRLAINRDIQKYDIKNTYINRIYNHYKLDNYDTINIIEPYGAENHISTFYKLLENIATAPEYGNFFILMNEEEHPYSYILPYTVYVEKYFMISILEIQRDNLDNIDNMAIELNKLENKFRQFKNKSDNIDLSFGTIRKIYGLPGLNKKEIRGSHDYRSY